MKKFRANLFAPVLCFIAIALLVLPIHAGSVLAKGGIKATTKMEHKPIKYFVPEKRIKLEAQVTDKQGVSLVRCYFRAVEQADYVFVAMNPGSSLYQGILPAPSKATEMLEYLFLVVNGKNQVVKTQTFKVEKEDEDETPAWQEVSSKGDIHVSTELAQAPTAPPGFTDSIAIDVVESSARFGLVVAGIYTAAQAAEAGGSTGMAAAADSAGTISAKTGRRSKMAYVGMGAALLAGGAAAARGGSSGGGHDHASTTSTTTIPTTTTSSTTSSTTTIPTTTSTTTVPTTTTSTTSTPSTTTSSTTSSTTIIPTTTSTTTVDSCTGNHPPQVLEVSLYGSPNTSWLCQGDYFAFTADCYDAESNYDIDLIRVRIRNTYTGAENVQYFTPDPSGHSTHFTVSRVTGYRAGWAQVQYCLYVQLRDKCGNWSNEGGACRYSSDCGHQ